MNQLLMQNDEIRREAESRLADPQSSDELAQAFVNLGCVCERECDWDMAIANYRQALDAASQDPQIRYFGHNNLGYSLIQQGRYDEAEPYCEAAIDIQPNRHNAHKNLGLSIRARGGGLMPPSVSRRRSAWPPGIRVRGAIWSNCWPGDRNYLRSRLICARRWIFCTG